MTKSFNNSTGSPLMVSGGAGPEHCANINILIGEEILTVLPTSTIADSEIPDIPDETKKQLEILKHNVTKLSEKLL
ncbi:hypothetical protein ABEB36_002523 [Hypothenemus hampei]|uniref:Borealin C-terminal domain-containing protein n=1 Tax=Hypothenemus hampei TaxID=57062 RepID=A0ABD1F6F9_HYPHA